MVVAHNREKDDKNGVTLVTFFTFYNTVPTKNQILKFIQITIY